MKTELVQGFSENRRIGHGEAIPRWSAASRLALGGWTLAMPVAAFALAGWATVSERDLPSSFFAATYGLLVMHFVLLSLYLSFAAQNPRLERARLGWMVALLVSGPVSIPAYWVIHVWNAPSVGRAGVDSEVPGYDESDAKADAAERAPAIG